MMESLDLQDRMMRMSLTQVNEYYEKNLRAKGTDVDHNKEDLYGDGDQSPVSRENAQFYRDMFAVGGDINHLADVGMTPLSDFAKLCVTGDVRNVKATLVGLAGIEQDKTAEPSPDLIALLEKRETALRLSPLMMVVSMGKNLAMPGMADKQLQVLKLLLQYGARPDARDVCGKTVCHYGMGAMATKKTLGMGSLCIEANDSTHLLWKKVELHSLKAASKNGLQGICKGYVDGRRTVYLLDSKSCISVKPENLKLVDPPMDGEEKAGPPKKLCNIQDRFGTVCLHEVVVSDRTDVAKVLLDTHEADLEIQDCDDISPLSMSISAMAGAQWEVANMIKKSAARYTKKVQQKQERTCSNCSKVESDSDKLLLCAKCKQVQYCGRECQLEHWKQGGHKKECKKLAAVQAASVVLERPTGGMWTTTISTRKAGRFNSSEPQRESEGYRKPSNVAVGETFDVKVQGGGPMMPLMIYDKSREFNIGVNPGMRGFDELRKSVNAEPTWQGRKTFVAASFDANGDCTVYPGMTSIHKW